MAQVDLTFFGVKLGLNNAEITFKFLFESIQSGVVQVDQLIHMNEVVSQGHLVLLLGFIEVSIQHLQNSVLSIDFSVVILLINLNFFFQLLGLGKSQQLSPMGENFHAIEVGHLLLLDHGVLQLGLTLLHHIGKLGTLLLVIVLVGISLLDLVWSSSIGSVGVPFNRFS